MADIKNVIAAKLAAAGAGDALKKSFEDMRQSGELSLNSDCKVIHTASGAKLGKYIKQVKSQRPDLFGGANGSGGASNENPFADESDAGQARRIAYIQQHGAAKSAAQALLVNRTITGQPRRK